MFIISSSLHDVKIRFSDGVRQGSVSPVFNREGVVSHLLVTGVDHAKICLIPWREGLVRKRMWRILELDVAWSDLKDCDDVEAWSVVSCWRFDTNRTLDDHIFQDHVAMDALKSMNIADLVMGPSELYYKRDLSAVYMVKRGEEITLFRQDALPPRTPPERPGARASKPGEWRLNPCWARR